MEIICLMIGIPSPPESDGAHSLQIFQFIFSILSSFPKLHTSSRKLTVTFNSTEQNVATSKYHRSYFYDQHSPSLQPAVLGLSNRKYLNVPVLTDLDISGCRLYNGSYTVTK